MQPTKGLVLRGTAIGVVVAGMFFAERVAVGQPDPPSDRVSAPPPSTPFIPALELIRYGNPNKLFLRSSVALVMDEREGVMLHERNIDEPRPIASLTKLMTAVVILDAKLRLDEKIEILRADRDRLRGTKSRLRYGAILTRLDMLHVALTGSDNRAAAALARTYPGGRDAMIEAMNNKARELGMTRSRFADSTGLDSGNVSTARDLAKLIAATRSYWLIRALSTSREVFATDWRADRVIVFRNTNYLVRKGSWNITLSKTGYTAAAGNCLVMRTTVANRPLVVILLNSWGRLSRYGDSNRIRQWLLNTERKIQTLSTTAAST